MTRSEGIRTPVTDLLGLRHPVLLAPMAGVSGGRLAAAVSRAGGLGLIGGGYGDAGWLGEQLGLIEQQPVGVGFISWALRQRPELLGLALSARPRAVMLSFGELQPAGALVSDAGAVLIAQVQTVGQAVEAVRQGAQIIVAQGGEAGGHGGLRGTLALVPAVVDAVAPVPVLAAGGIADGRGLAAALMLGAAGALCGTLFYASVESLAHQRAKQALVQASGDDTVKSPLYDLLRGLDWPAGPWGLRTLGNALTRRWSGDLDALRQDLALHRAQLQEARDRGDFEVAPVIAGEAADLVGQIGPAEQALLAMVGDCARLLERAPQHLHSTLS